MAEKMFISEQKVKNHTPQHLDKLGVSTVGLALYAITKACISINIRRSAAWRSGHTQTSRSGTGVLRRRDHCCATVFASIGRYWRSLSD